MGDTLKCKKGWLIAPDNTGRYTPFFLYVRSNDIVWSDMVNSNASKLVNNSDGAILINPTSAYRFVRKGWTLTVYSDMRYDADATISVGDNFNFTDNDFPVELYRDMELPFSTIDDELFHVICTKQVRQDELRSSEVNILPSGKDRVYHDKIRISLLNPIYQFHTDFKNMTDYKNSKIHLHIQGNLYTEPVSE